MVGATLAVARDVPAVARDDQTEPAGASPAPTCDWSFFISHHAWLA